jgi:hypothetical protein
MRLTLGEATGNTAAAVRMYAEMYPQRRLPNPRTFQDIDRHIRKTDTVRPSAADVGWRRSVRTVGVGERSQFPHRFSRIQAAKHVAFTTVWRVLDQQLAYSYYLHRVWVPSRLNCRPRQDFATAFFDNVVKTPFWRPCTLHSTRQAIQGMVYWISVRRRATQAHRVELD